MRAGEQFSGVRVALVVHLLLLFASLRCLPVNTGHMVGVGTSHDAQGRTFTDFIYTCDVGRGDHEMRIACVTQPSGQTACECKRDRVTLRSFRSPSLPGVDAAISACRFPR